MGTGVRFLVVAALTGMASASMARTPAPTPFTIDAAPTIHTAMLPGGVESLQAALGDGLPIEPAFLISEIARRVHGGTDRSATHDTTAPKLRSWIEACRHGTACRDRSRADAVPLPGPPAFWREAVLGTDVPDEQLILSILADRRASLLHTALLGFDEETRAWLVGQTELVRRLTPAQAGALAVVSPYVRQAAGRWQLPGGERADPVWSNLAGTVPGDAPRFLLRLIDEQEGRLAYVIEAAATLSRDQLAHALALDAADPGARAAAGRRFADALRGATRFWLPGQRPFWRPSPDPAFLLAQLPVQGSPPRLALPGGRKFWSRVFDERNLEPDADDAREAWEDEDPVTAAWLLDRVFAGTPEQVALHYELVLYGARHFAASRPEAARDVLTALRAYPRLPELLRTLERAGVVDPALVAGLARTAARLSPTDRGWRGHALLVQWQSAIVLIARAARLAGTPPAELTSALQRLASPSLSGGDVLRALTAWIDAEPARASATDGSLERALMGRLTASAVPPRTVQWEEASYRIDFARTEQARLARVRGRAAPLFDAAVEALALATAPGTEGAAAATRLEGLVATAKIGAAVPFEDAFMRAARESAAAAKARLGEARRGANARAAFDDLALALGASALLELSYATAMGWAPDLPISAAAASRRHVLAIGAAGVRARDLSWAAPQIVTDAGVPWHVQGSVLGLDLALAPVVLRRLSLKPLARQPTLVDPLRDVLTRSVVLFDRQAFGDAAQRTVVDALQKGRARVAAVRDTRDAARVAAGAGVSPARSTLAAWTAVEDPPAWPRFFSLTELVRLGLDGRAPAGLDGWGNDQSPLSGSAVAGALPTLFVERYAGRWATGTLAAAMPNLQLALADRLAQLDLPAALIPDLMPAAVLDFMSQVPVRHSDDWLALARWPSALPIDSVERYLGLLTTDGPLRVDRPLASER